MSNELIFKGNQEFMGKNIPVVYGGFGENQKCVTAKTVAEIHETRLNDINTLIDNNLSEFEEGIDLLDLKTEYKNSTSLNGSLLLTLGYNKQSIANSRHIYLLSEQGYMALVGLMKTEKAKNLRKQFRREYFLFKEKEEKQIQSQPASSLDVSALQAINEAVRIILPAVEAIGIDPVHKSYLLKQMYEKAGICIPSLKVKQDTVLYTKTQIAQKLGLYSEHNRPHAQAIGAILKKLTIDPNDSVLTSYNRQGHTGVVYQYKPAVLQQVKKWIIDNDYPSIIYNCTTEYSIRYKEVGALA